MRPWSRRAFLGGGLATVAAACTSDRPDQTAAAVESISYGDDPDQVGDLYLPPGQRGSVPVVVLIHGGFWRVEYARDLMAPLAEDLAARGFAVWNIEYRRVGQPGGGWPGTFDDVAAAVNRLAPLGSDRGLDLARVVTVGHSAGGHLALWAAGRHTTTFTQAGEPETTVAPVAAVAQAGIPNLARCTTDGLGGGACPALMGGRPDDVPERYAEGSPAEFLPLQIRQLLVHGERDDIVPVTHSQVYAEAAEAAGDDVELVVVPDADHFDVIDPGHEAWRAVTDRLPDLA